MIQKYNNFIKCDVIIEVLNGPYWNFILNEDFDYYNRAKNVELSDEHKNELKEAKNVIEEYLLKINPFRGEYFNEQSKLKKIINFKITPTYHWYVKFLRKEYENDKYIKPGTYEGINMVYNNIDEITRLIDNCTIKNNSRVLIKSKDMSKYTEIVIFEKIDKMSYNILLQTQMKGKEYIDSSVDRTIKLHVNGPIKNKNVTVGL